MYKHGLWREDAKDRRSMMVQNPDLASQWTRKNIRSGVIFNFVIDMIGAVVHVFV